MNNEELLTNLNARQGLIERVEVLEKVGNLLLLPNTEIATSEMVAKYYNVPLETINTLVKRNREELGNNGYSLSTKENLLKFNLNFKTKRGGFSLLDSEGNIIGNGNNKGIHIFTKRAILNIGMLLEKSKVAEEVRSRLLDLTCDVLEEAPELVENVVEEIRTEIQISEDMTKAIMSGDFMRLSILQTELIALKNKRIKDLENKWNSFLDSEGCITFTEFAKIVSTGTDKIEPIKISGKKLTSLLRDKGILNKTKKGSGYSNLPNQNYESYFNVSVTNLGNGHKTTQTKINSKGLDFIYDFIKENIDK